MKRFRKWQRIIILSSLSFSLCAPIVLVSYRLKSPVHEGPMDFVEDLTSIKYRADALKLSAIQEEDAKGLKEPKQEVYKDQKYSVVSFSSIESLKAKQSDNDKNRIYSLGRKATHHGLRKQNLENQRREAPSTNTHNNKAPPKPTQPQEQHADFRMSQHDQRIISSHARSQTSHGLQLHQRRELNEKVEEMKDQQIRARTFLRFATTEGNVQLGKELRQRIREIERGLGEAKKSSGLTRRILLRMRNMEATLSKASSMYAYCSAMVDKLRAMTQDADEQVKVQKRETTFLTQLAGRSTPKGLHCLSMRLTTDYLAQPFERQEPVNQLNLYNPGLYHYAVFSDNVLACAVVVNSTVSAAKEPEKVVFHVVTDSLNFPGISMWFRLNPPGSATIQVQSIDSFETLLSKYGPIVALNMDRENSVDPRYSSPLNHLRFFLPELFPHLDKIVFLEHDVVVLKDLSDLWGVEMKGKVNGAVQTCHKGEPSNHRMDTLVNFSDPWVAENFDADACTWAFGMNLFDLREWRNQDLSAKYHRYLLMASKRPLWKPGSLPLGWITFYNHTIPLNATWLLLGLGHEANVSQESIEQVAVIHYDGIMKPWLEDIRIKRYKGYWAKHVNFDHPYLRQCNIHGS